MKNQTNDEQKTKAIADAETRIADLTIRTHWSNHSIRTDRILHHALKAHHRSIRLEARGVTTNGHICPLEASCVTTNGHICPTEVSDVTTNDHICPFEARCVTTNGHICKTEVSGVAAKVQ